MAIYLPLVTCCSLAGTPLRSLLPFRWRLCRVRRAVRRGPVRTGSQPVCGAPSDEIILLTVLGTVLLVGGIAQRFQVSAAIGAFLVGIAVSGPIAEQSQRLFSPLRDLFAATFFFFFGLQIDPATLPHAIPFAVGLGVVTALTKIGTGTGPRAARGWIVRQAYALARRWWPVASFLL